MRLITIVYLIICGLLFFSLTNCGPTPLIEGTISAPTVTRPSSSQSTDIYFDQGTHNFLDDLLLEHENGRTITISPALQHKYGDEIYSGFFVEKNQFVGEYKIVHSFPGPRDFAIICLINHIQIPCHPTLEKVNFLTIDPKVYTYLPLQINGLQNLNVYDFDFITVIDPYQDMDDPYADSRTFARRGEVLDYSIHVQGHREPPVIEIESDLEVMGKSDNINSLVKPHNLAGLYKEVEYGKKIIPWWTEAEGEPGKELSFYLHFANERGNTDDTIGVVAFINYQQVPLIVDGKPKLPLYVHNDAGKWQRLPVSIRLPDEVGTYEMVIGAVSDVFRLGEDVQGRRWQDESDEVSGRILLHVKHPDPTRTPFADLPLEKNRWRLDELLLGGFPIGDADQIEKSDVTFENNVMTITTDKVTTSRYSLDQTNGIFNVVFDDGPPDPDDDHHEMLYSVFHGEHQFTITEDRLVIKFGRDDIGQATFFAEEPFEH